MEKFMFQDRSPKDREQLLRDNATKVESMSYMRPLDSAQVIELQNTNTRKVIENKNIYLPKVSNTAIDVLEGLMQQFKAGAVSNEVLEQTKAVCNITKQMIDVGRLELDYIKQQTTN